MNLFLITNQNVKIKKSSMAANMDTFSIYTKWLEDILVMQ